MKNTLKTNGVYGAKIGNKIAFTREGAINIFKTFVEVCYNNITIESSYVLSEVSQDMHRIGFSFEELEQLELEVISA